MFAGFLLDRFGRKWLYIFGFVVVASYLTGLCYIGSIYPGILVLTICSKVFGASLLMNTPFTADYVQKESMGSTIALIYAISDTGGILVQSGFVGLQKAYDLSFNLFFLGTAAATILGIIPMIFCLKDVSGKKKKDATTEDKRNTSEILRAACWYLKKERRLLMAYFGNAVSISTFFSTALFGSNIYY